MLLAVQIYAPLDGSPNHRTLYQFCCLAPQCHSKKEGWICLRDEVADTSTTLTSAKVQTATTASTTTWIDDADDWGDDENMESDTGTPTTINDRPDEVTVHALDIGSLTIQNMDSSNPEHPAPSNSADTCDNMMNVPTAEVEGVEESVLLDDLPPQPTVDIRTFFAPPSAPIPDFSSSEFSSFYLNVVEEQYAAVLSDQKLDERAKQLWEEYQRRENCDLKQMQKSSKSTPGRVDEVYEKVPPSHGDRLVHKFVTQVQACPEQLIRYNRGASNPLLLKQLAKEDPLLLKCQHCNATLVFEMQLMPHLGQRLTIEDSAAQTPGIELDTVLIYSCSKSCWNGVPREEYLIVQTEIY